MRDAHFEAGHAIVAWLENLEIIRVSINRDGDASSWIEIREPVLSPSRLRSSPRVRRQVKSIIRGLLAGPASQQKYSFGACAREFNIADRHLIDQETAWRAVSLAGALHADGPALLPSFWSEVTATIQTPEIWATVEAVAAALLGDRELAGCEVDEIARYAMKLTNEKSAPNPN
jgi:hypothetical protein